MNDAIRRGLSPGRTAEPARPYRVKPHRTTGLRAVHSNDGDLGRFEGLRWVNPLAR